MKTITIVFEIDRVDFDAWQALLPIQRPRELSMPQGRPPAFRSDRGLNADERAFIASIRYYAKQLNLADVTPAPSRLYELFNSNEDLRLLVNAARAKRERRKARNADVDNC